MTETKPKRTGRPPLPQPPQNAAACRALMAQETVRTSPSERRLRHLYRLLKAFVAAEEAARVDEQNRVEAEQNRLEQEELELQRAEYRRRYFSAGLGLQENERLRKRIAELEQRIAELEAEKMPVNSSYVPTLSETGEGTI